MAQLHPHLWHTHPDVSPFVPLNAALVAQNFAGLAAQGRGAEAAARQPESMQVDSTSAAPGGAAASSSSSVEGHHSAHRGNQSEAGPSGVPPGGAPYDAQMAEPQQRKPARKHSEAPMRKLSVSLIDTYKLINQVRAFWPDGRARRRHRAACGRGRGAPAACGVACGAAWPSWTRAAPAPRAAPDRAPVADFLGRLGERSRRPSIRPTLG